MMFQCVLWGNTYLAATHLLQRSPLQLYNTLSAELLLNVTSAQKQLKTIGT